MILLKDNKRSKLSGDACKKSKKKMITDDKSEKEMITDDKSNLVSWTPPKTTTPPKKVRYKQASEEKMGFGN